MTLPPSVRVIRRARAWLERRRAAAVAMLVLFVAAAWMGRGFYTVDNGESAALLRFGRLLTDALGPGLHFRVAGGDEILKARTGEVFRAEIQSDQLRALSLLTGDENVIDASLVVQYRISGLGDYLFQTESPTALLDQVVKAALLAEFAQTPVEEVLTSAKAAIQNRVREEAQQRLDSYGSGVVVVAVNLQTVTPQDEAAAAFRSVSDARAQAAQAVNQARGERERGLRLARGEAGKLLEEAQAAADGRLHGAQGAVQRFESLLARKRIAPGQTEVELYTSTLQKVLPPARLVVLAEGKSPRVEVNLLERGAPSAPKPRGAR